MRKHFTWLVFLVGCGNGPEPIFFGEQTCHYCKMTIVDQQHAAQAITSKGKVYNFDAIECMVNMDIQSPKKGFEKYYACNYEDPGVLIDAENSAFLISKKIPSPMGAFLTAFPDTNAAKKVGMENEDIILTWSQLRERFKNYHPDPDN